MPNVIRYPGPFI